MNELLLQTYTENFLNFAADKVDFKIYQKQSSLPNVSYGPEIIYTSKQTNESFDSMLFLADISYIQETVPNEFQALRDIFSKYTASYDSDGLWTVINEVDCAYLEDFCERVDDVSFHNEESMDAFYEEARNAITAIETAFREETGITIQSVMTYEDQNWETLLRKEHGIVPTFGPNFNVIDWNSSVDFESEELKDHFGIYLYDN